MNPPKFRTARPPQRPPPAWTDTPGVQTLENLVTGRVVLSSYANEVGGSYAGFTGSLGAEGRNSERVESSIRRKPAPNLGLRALQTARLFGCELPCRAVNIVGFTEANSSIEAFTSKTA